MPPAAPTPEEGGAPREGVGDEEVAPLLVGESPQLLGRGHCVRGTLDRFDQRRKIPGYRLQQQLKVVAGMSRDRPRTRRVADNPEVRVDPRRGT